jgi:hypothetical protein
MSWIYRRSMACSTHQRADVVEHVLDLLLDPLDLVEDHTDGLIQRMTICDGRHR